MWWATELQNYGLTLGDLPTTRVGKYSYFFVQRIKKSNPISKIACIYFLPDNHYVILYTSIFVQYVPIILIIFLTQPGLNIFKKFFLLAFVVLITIWSWPHKPQVTISVLNQNELELFFYGYMNLSYLSIEISQHHKITPKFFLVLEISSRPVTVKTLRLTSKCYLGCIFSRIYFPQLPKSSVFQASLIGFG